MRMIGQIQGETKARTFSNYLYVQGIDNQVEADKDGDWALWIHAEEELDRARTILAEYQSNPDDPKYKESAREAVALKERKEKEQKQFEKRVKERRHLFRPMSGYGFGPVTYVLITICIAVFILQNLGPSIAEKTLTKLLLTDYSTRGLRGLLEVRHGEIWRLVTPIFLHFSIMHIVFNMWILLDLGSMIEGRQSSLYFLALTLVLAVGSNLTQYYVYGPSLFGGMSGVDYGLFGYIWIRGKLDPGSGLYVQPSTVMMMIVWFFLCLSGWVGVIANGAHGGGLVLGMLWGWLSSLRRR